jgi:SAM-dependent methyltransferase
MDRVRDFWQQNPVCAADIAHDLGTPDYFAAFDAMREELEPPAFGTSLHEWDRASGKSVLAVGCGNGFVLSRYARHGARVTGVDIAQAAVDLSKARFAQAGLSGDFRVANAEALPFADDTFDYVCSMGVLHHTPDTARAVAEILRVLRPGGRLIAMFYHRNSARYRFKIPLLRWRTRKSTQQLVNEVDGEGNPKGEVYSKRELAHLLRDFTELELFAGGLAPQEVFPTRLVAGSGIVPRIGRPLARALLRPFERSIGWFLYAKGRKP